MRGPVQKQQPFWDKVVLLSICVVWVAWMPLMGLDAERFHWSNMPAGLQIVGGLLMLISFRMIGRVFLENTFLAPVVKIQSERDHHVISTGPYAIVRHPLYSSVLIFLPGMALLLGSWYGLAGVLAFIAGIVVRTALEDRELQRRLPGYAEYATRVRYRLVPHLW
jgi:protein-S-isoprenylcysteine O-methyltransferase Ste14